MKRFNFFNKRQKTLTLEQSNDIFNLCNTFSKNKDLSVEDVEKYFKNGTQTLADFYQTEIETLTWFDYAKHGTLVSSEINLFVDFLYDVQEWKEEVYENKDKY